MKEKIGILGGGQLGRMLIQKGIDWNMKFSVLDPDAQAPCAEIAEFYANGSASFLADQPMNVAGIDAWIQHAPLGVILGVMPWNFPFYQVVRFATPNIMAGNTVLLKHAGNVPQCALKIQELFDECELPRGVYTNLFISTEMVETILSDKRVRGVSLTGSERAGSAVAALAGKFLKRSVL